MNYDDYIYSGGVAVIGSFMSWFLGEANGVVKVLLIMVIIDYVSGVMKAAAAKELSSKASAKGIMHKVVVFLFVGIANVIDHELMGATDFLRDGVCLFYISTEGISVLENAIALGVPIPEALKDTFIQWRQSQQNKKQKQEE